MLTIDRDVIVKINAFNGRSVCVQGNWTDFDSFSEFVAELYVRSLWWAFSIDEQATPDVFRRSIHAYGLWANNERDD